MKTILLTWGTGFLGSHFIEDLRKKYKIILLKRSFSSLKNIENFLDDVVVYDRDMNELELIFQSHQIDIIVHTATNYWRSNSYLSDIIDANLYFPMRLLDLALKYNSTAFINTDTFWDQNIELPKWLKYYALTKKDFLKYASISIEWNENFKFLNLKVEHLYWLRDDEKKFIPYIIKSFLDNKDSIDLTKWEQKRDFIYVKDAISAYDYILSNLEKIGAWFESFEIWTWEAFSIRDVVERLKQISWANTELSFGALDYRKWETMEAKADIGRLFDFWWKNMYSLEEWLRLTVNSMRL